jgi:cytochrome c2
MDRSAVRTLTLAAFAALLLAPLSGCERPGPDAPRSVAGGDAARGVQLMRYYGCATCHTIPGVPSAKGRIGPSLEGVRDRAFIGGVLSNTSENLVRWIHSPREHSPRTAMPDTGISEAEARHVAAYLYSR